MKLKLFAICLGLFSITFTAFSDTKSDELINANIKTMGGKEKLGNIKTLYFEVNMEVPSQNMNLKLTIFEKKPDMIRFITEIPAMSMKMEAGTDGKEFWATQPGSDAKSALPESAVPQIKQQINSFKSMISSPVLDYNTEEVTTTYKGVQDINEKKYNVVEFSEKEGSKFDMYFDVITNLIYSTKIEVEAQGSKFLIENKIVEYQKKDGIFFPKRIEIYQNGEIQQKITIENIQINSEMNNSDFKVK